MRKPAWLTGIVTVGMLVAVVGPAAAAEEVSDEPTLADMLEVEVDPGVVVVGDEVEVEVEFALPGAADAVEPDGEDTNGEPEEGDSSEEAAPEQADDSEEAAPEETDAADEAAEEPVVVDEPAGDEATEDEAVDPVPGDAVLPSFAVDFGDGSEPVAMTVEAVDDGEVEAEAEARHRYQEVGTYTVRVDATWGSQATSIERTVDVTDEPAANKRGFERACPPGLAKKVEKQPNPGKGRFWDVAPGSPHRDAIDCVEGIGVARGYGSTFAPGQQVRRAQLATFLVRLLERVGIDLPDAPQDAFGDDDGGAHEDSINRLAAAGLLGGTSEGEYSPSDAVSRGQMAAVLVRAIEHAQGQPLPDGADYFEDDDTSVHEPAINRAARAGLSTGRTRTAFDPGTRLTRAQAATFLARAMDLLAEAGVEA